MLETSKDIRGPRFKVGDKVLYSGGFGRQEPVETNIVDVGEKNYRIVYGNTLGHWGYEDQYIFDNSI
jgi:hypothetical protein